MMPPAAVACTATWATAPLPGAIAILQLHGEIRPALAALLGDAAPPLAAPLGGAAAPATGRISLRRIADVDDGIIALIDERNALIMPHGGPRICEVIREKLAAIGIESTREQSHSSPRALFPEATSDADAHILALLSLAESPLAIPHLLNQLSAGRDGRGPGTGAGAAPLAAAPGESLTAQQLRALIDPPTVAVIGRPNAGKSTLLNRLAGRTLAIASPEPGTTRDAVGARLDFAGLVISWLDTPGVRADAGDMEREAMRLTEPLLQQSDLVILLAEPGGGWPSWNGAAPTLRVLSKSDLPAAAACPERQHADAVLSALTGDGIEPFVTLVRDRLLGATTR